MAATFYIELHELADGVGLFASAELNVSVTRFTEHGTRYEPCSDDLEIDDVEGMLFVYDEDGDEVETRGIGSLRDLAPFADADDLLHEVDKVADGEI